MTDEKGNVRSMNAHGGKQSTEPKPVELTPFQQITLMRNQSYEMSLRLHALAISIDQDAKSVKPSNPYLIDVARNAQTLTSNLMGLVFTLTSGEAASDTPADKPAGAEATKSDE